MNEPSEVLTLRIEKPIYGGAGLARHNGQVVLTQLTLPGELVTAAVTYTKSSFQEARLLEVLEASPDRSPPPCPYFGTCGGCHYQHAAYAAQLAIKATILSETLTRARLADLPRIVTHSGEPLGYRNRIRLHLDSKDSALGYRERATHRLLPVDRCPIAAPTLEQALAALRAICTRMQSGRSFSEVEMSINHDGSELLLGLWLRAPLDAREAEARLHQLCEALHAAVPALRGAGVHRALEERDARSSRRPRSSRSGKLRRDSRSMHAKTAEGAGSLDGSHSEWSAGKPIAIWGTPWMTYHSAGMDYRVSLGSFFQVNRSLVDGLVTLATGSRSGGLAWDLYAGVGLFSRVLAQHFEQVVAVEGAPSSFEDLGFNLKQPHQAIRSSTLEFLRRHAGAANSRPAKSAAHDRGSSESAAGRPEFVLVDPPRAGLGSEVTALLGQIRPEHITYVSCDPATLARDLSSLVKSGYQLQQLHLIDLFPQTFHLEAAAMLSLG